MAKHRKNCVDRLHDEAGEGWRRYYKAERRIAELESKRDAIEEFELPYIEKLNKVFSRYRNADDESVCDCAIRVLRDALKMRAKILITFINIMTQRIK